MTSSLHNLKQWPTSSVVDRFISVLSPFGSMDIGEFAPIPGLNNKASDFKAAMEEARVLTDELNRRADPDAGDRLWASQNPAVRIGVLALLTPDAPREFRLGAMIGPLSNLPDEKAGRLFLEALATNEDRASLKNLGEDELVERFVEFCLRNFMAWNFFSLHDDREQIEASNNIITEIMRILVVIKERGLLDRLVPLLKHDNQNVRLWSAYGALFIDEDAALAALTAISGEGAPESARMFRTPGPGLTNMSAADALKRWRNERRGVYGLNPGDNMASQLT
jgi:hypothetical protein